MQFFSLETIFYYLIVFFVLSSVANVFDQLGCVNFIFPKNQMQEAVEKNMEKVLSEKKEVDKKKEDQLKNLNPALVARIRAKEAKKVAQQMTRDPEKDKEVCYAKLFMS